MSELLVGWDYPDGFSAFFGEDDETGYLYVGKGKKIIEHLQIYNVGNNERDIREQDVQVIRSKDGNKFGVVIWKELRGVIDIKNKSAHKDTRGIADPDWLKG